LDFVHEYTKHIALMVYRWWTEMSEFSEFEDDLDITVSRYVPVAECPGFTAPEIAAFQLPTGFPLLVNRHSGQIIEPVFRYLYERVKGYARNSTAVHQADPAVRERAGPKRRLRQIRLGSATAAADNLRLWFGYLALIPSARRADSWG
jgi:hypothetical protein